MLSTPANFPNIGCTAFLGLSAQQVRLIQRNANGTCLISICPGASATSASEPPGSPASGNRTVDAGDLFETPLAALHAAPRHKRARRRAGGTA